MTAEEQARRIRHAQEKLREAADAVGHANRPQHVTKLDRAVEDTSRLLDELLASHQQLRGGLTAIVDLGLKDDPRAYLTNAEFHATVEIARMTLEAATAARGATGLLVGKHPKKEQGNVALHDEREAAAAAREEPACPYCGMTAQVAPSRREPGRWMCHGCAETFDAAAREEEGT